MKMKRIVLDFLSVNCYLLCNEQTGEALLVDPGSSTAKIFAAVEAEKVKVVGILLTHAHVDHVSAVAEVAEKYNAPVWIHPDDYGIYFSRDNALPPYMMAPANLPQPVKDCPTAGMDFQILHTPGHTPGGVCYYFPAEKVVFTGDTLFCGTYGRTDFPGGSDRAIFASIKDVLFKLPGETRVFPGHEQSTTIAKEQANPIFM